jgi:hypothetical protein
MKEDDRPAKADVDRQIEALEGGVSLIGTKFLLI